MKLIRRQKIWLSLVIVTNLLLWLIPSDVVELIARDRQTLLGRYSRAHFTWIIAVALISVVSLYVDWSTGEKYKRRWFQVMATLMVVFPAIGIVDFFMRSPERSHYVRDRLAYHRPVKSSFEFQFDDKPATFCTYPNAQPGYGTVSGIGRTDKRGFRNATDRDRADIVVLGDSFAEGSSVSDDQVWPVHLAERLGVSVTNLGMSGYSPAHYLASFKDFGLALKPSTVLCLLYEGNDFRSSKGMKSLKDISFSKRIKTYFKQSPVKQALEDMMLRTFGPINTRRAIPGIEILDWLPVAVPQGPGAKYYAFGPKTLRDLYVSREDFAGHPRWLVVRKQLREMNSLCDAAGCRFVLAYAPTKTHVILPLIDDRVSAEDVRSFTAISYKHALPEADLFLANLVARVDAREAVVAQWCDDKAIPFISLTKPLRAAVESGTQAYYTYDQHWSPDGHALVAKYIADSLTNEKSRTKPDLGEG